MDDPTVGIIGLSLCVAVFTYYTLWVIVSPFYEPISLLFPPVRYALIIPAFIGILFIGSLVIFTTIKIRNTKLVN